MILNAFLNIGLLGILIAAGIGIMGVCILVYATSEVLHNPAADSPIPGALILFAGLFNVFVALLNIFLRLEPCGDDPGRIASDSPAVNAPPNSKRAIAALLFQSPVATRPLRTANLRC